MTPRTDAKLICGRVPIIFASDSAVESDKRPSGGSLRNEAKEGHGRS